MAKKNLDELEAKSPGRFAGLKKAVFGDEQEMEVPSGLLEHFDAYTGAPSRSAVEKLQEDFTDVPGALEAARKQFGASPKLAPSGKDLAKNTGLTGVAGDIAGAGLEMVLDPTQLLTGGLGPALKGIKAASMIPFGIKALKAADTVADVAKAAKASDNVMDAARGLKAADTMGMLAGDIQKGKSAARQIAEARQLQAAADATKALDVVEAAKKESAMADLYKELTGQSLPSDGARVFKATPKNEELVKAANIFDEVPASSAAEALRMAKTGATTAESGKILTVPGRFEQLQAAMKAKKK